MFCIEISLFFWDISAKILKNKDVAILKENIAVKLCNLKKIFPPLFCDVMEHLVVHLPDEAALGGPVQYRWMSPFERYIYHVKKKIKIKNILQVPLFSSVLLRRFLELLHITLEIQKCQLLFCNLEMFALHIMIQMCQICFTMKVELVKK